MKKTNKASREGHIPAALIMSVGAIIAAVIAGTVALFMHFNPINPEEDRDLSPTGSSSGASTPTSAAKTVLDLDDTVRSQEIQRENFTGYSWKQISPVIGDEQYRSGVSCIFSSDDRITGFLEFPVNDDQSSFTAVAGIEQNAENVGFEARFSVVDAFAEKTLKEGVATPGVPVEFDVPVDDVDRIRLVVESVGATESLNDYDGVVVWADPTLQ